MSAKENRYIISHNLRPKFYLVLYSGVWIYENRG